MPTGWRPDDVAGRFPVYKIEDPNHFEKYDPPASMFLQVWSWIQLSMLLLFISYLFGNIAYIGKPHIFIYGGFIFLMVYAFTELMDGNRFAVWWGLLFSLTGAGIIFYTGDWFGIAAFFPFTKYILLFYFAISFFITVLISKNQMQANKLSVC